MNQYIYSNVYVFKWLFIYITALTALAGVGVILLHIFHQVIEPVLEISLLITSQQMDEKTNMSQRLSVKRKKPKRLKNKKSKKERVHEVEQLREQFRNLIGESEQDTRGMFFREDKVMVINYLGINLLHPESLQ